MRRFLATLRHDLLLQLRYGFLYAGIFVTLFWIAILSLFSSESLRVALPVFMFLNASITTIFFVAGWVLYEKREGVLEALVVTPLRHSHYLASKITVLTGLAAVETLAIALLGWGTDLQLLPVVVGIVGIGVINTLFGLLIVFRYDSVNEFLLPAGLFSTFLQLPVVATLGVLETNLFYLWPTQGPLLLLQAGFQPITQADTIYALLCSTLWIVGAAWLARSSFARFIVRSEGTA